MSSRRGTLRRRLALWIFLSTALSFVNFALIAYVVVLVEEQDEIESGEPEDIPGDARDEVLTALAFAAPVGLALATGGALWLTRRALAPVDRVIAAASEITTEDLDRRIPLEGATGELRALVDALNGLLARLERGYQGLSLFAADASHALRTPMAVIASELEVALRRTRTTAEWEASARTALEELRRLGKLVDALLLLTRSGAAPGRAQRIDLAAFADEVVSSHQARAREAGVSLAGPVVDDAPAVEAVPDALGSALSNLLANAIRYTPRGAAVALSLERRAPGRVALLVDDGGPGLAEGEVESVFTPFWRGAQGRARDAAGGEPVGLGLGLAIARRVVEQHGGRLTAENRTAGGARFTIELPEVAGRPR
jgi:signal transduction histidine kinase